MSVREEERNKNCPSRGLGIAAAAIGVGVGAALYYYFSKRPENPADEGATSSGWISEQPHDNLNSSYTTISEHSTSDTSIDTDSQEEVVSCLQHHLRQMHSIARRLRNSSTDNTSDSDSDSFVSTATNYSISSVDDTIDMDNIDSDSDSNMEWDVTTSSLDIPIDEPRLRSPNIGDVRVSLLTPLNSRWKSASEPMAEKRKEAFRKRPWTLEECSICFEVMLLEQEVLTLSCTHRFHQACVMPWLQEQQTCPNCRKTS